MQVRAGAHAQGAPLDERVRLARSLHHAQSAAKTETVSLAFARNRLPAVLKTMLLNESRSGSSVSVADPTTADALPSMMRRSRDPLPTTCAVGPLNNHLQGRSIPGIDRGTPGPGT